MKKFNFRSRPKITAFIASAVLLIAVGCQSAQFKDPNDPNLAGANQGHILRMDVKVASDTINDRVSLGEISDVQGRAILKAYAIKRLDETNINAVNQQSAWEYADVMITAQRWSDAQKMLEIALQKPDTEDRKVNDTLRLAHCEAELGHVDEAIKIARESFAATPHWKWPILYAVYLEIVPAALLHSKGKELELAQLTIDAIHQHELAQGDSKNKSEVLWLATRDFQIQRAYAYAISLFHQIHRDDLAKEAAIAASKVRPQPIQA